MNPIFGALNTAVLKWGESLPLLSFALFSFLVVQFSRFVLGAKASYNDALKNLEQISEEIHKMREERRLSSETEENYDVSQIANSYDRSILTEINNFWGHRRMHRQFKRRIFGFSVKVKHKIESDSAEKHWEIRLSTFVARFWFLSSAGKLHRTHFTD